MDYLSNDSTYIGTRLKYVLEIAAQGFSMEKDRFCVDICRGPNTLHFDKLDLEFDDDGNYYVCFDSLALGTGKVYAVVTAYVPDTDYPDGFRKEVQKIDLLQIKA